MNGQTVGEEEIWPDETRPGPRQPLNSEGQPALEDQAWLPLLHTQAWRQVDEGTMERLITLGDTNPEKGQRLTADAKRPKQRMGIRQTRKQMGNQAGKAGSRQHALQLTGRAPARYLEWL